MFTLQRSPLAALHSAQLLPTLIPSPPTPPTESSDHLPMESAAQMITSSDNMAYEKLLMAAGLEHLLNQQPDFEKLALQLFTMQHAQPTLSNQFVDLFGTFGALPPVSNSSAANLSPVMMAAATAQMNAQLSASIAALHNQMSTQLASSNSLAAQTTATTVTNNSTPTINTISPVASTAKNALRRRPQPLQLTQSNFQPNSESTDVLSSLNPKNQASPLDLSVKSASSTTSSTSRFSLDLLFNAANAGRLSPSSVSSATILSSPIDLSAPSGQHTPISPRTQPASHSIHAKSSLCKKKKLIASLASSSSAASSITTSITSSLNMTASVAMPSTTNSMLNLSRSALATIAQPPPHKKQRTGVFTATDSSALATALTAGFSSSASSAAGSTSSGSASSSQSPSPALPISAALQVNLDEVLNANASSKPEAAATEKKAPVESRPNKRKFDSNGSSSPTLTTGDHKAEVAKRVRAKTVRASSTRKNVSLPFELLPRAQLSGAVLVNAERVFTCEQCGEAFAFADRLQKHCKSKHGQPANADRSGQNSPDGSSPGSPGAKAFHCNICDRSFSRSDMLTRHSRLHSGHKPYNCQVCAQVFSRSDHLATHRRTHSGEKPYKCSMCPYSACRRDMITRHMRTHLGRRATTPLLDISL